MPGQILQDVQFLDKYSRQKGNGSRESWYEAIDRVMLYLYNLTVADGRDGLDASDYDKIHAAMVQKRAMPSMRALAMAGIAAERHSMTIYNCTYAPVIDLDVFREAVIILMNGAGFGYSVERKYIDRLPEIEVQSGENAGVMVVPDTTEGWANAIALGIWTWRNGKDLTFDTSQIRPEGTPLKTKGGIASGPQHLEKTLERIKAVILARQGMRLRPLDCHDILCHIADAVVSGGVRRSAMICLFDETDYEMLTCKSGDNLTGNEQRWNANNSIVIDGYKDHSWFSALMENMHASGRGEPGLFSRYAINSQSGRDPGEWSIDDWGTNPCVTADTWVMTDGGAKQVKDLINKPLMAIVDGRAYSSTDRGFFRTGNKPVYLIETAEGYTFKATADHPILCVSHQTPKKQYKEWRNVEKIVSGDMIKLHNHRGISWGGNGDAEIGWLLGSLAGDGTFTRHEGKSDTAHLRYWGDSGEIMGSLAHSLVTASVRVRSDMKPCYHRQNRYWQVSSSELANIAAAYGIYPKNKQITPQIEAASSAFYSGFLRGLFDADGTIGGSPDGHGSSVRVSQSNHGFLQGVQRMLLRLGIISTIYQDRHAAGFSVFPDGRGGSKEYYTKASHELVISNDNIHVYNERIGFSDPGKAAKLSELLLKYKREPNRERFVTRVKSVTLIANEDVYDCTIPEIHAFDANGFYVHNCGEIVLKPFQMCNLSSAVCRADDTRQDIREKVESAAIIGTIQSLANDFPGLRDEWSRNNADDRLLGVDLMGIMDCDAVRDPAFLLELNEIARATNERIAARLGINKAAAITCVKPSGNSSVLLDASPGIHARWSRYYIRRVTFVEKNPIRKALAAAGVPMEKKIGTDNQWVVSFPIKSPDGAIVTGDLTALDQLNNWLLFKRYWTDHNPSCTITYKPEEIETIAAWLYDNQSMIGGLSFLPHFDAKYAQMPYEAIDAARYDALVANFPLAVDLSNISGAVNVAATPACDGDICELPL